MTDNKVQDVRYRKKRFGDRSTIEKGFRPEDFYSREDVLHNQIKIPRTNKRVLIVPPVYDGWGFRVDEYDPEFCKDLDEFTFKNTIRLCNKTIQVGYRKRREIGRGNQSNWANLLLLVGTITGFSGFVMMEYMINTDNDDIYWALGVSGLFGFSLLVAILVFISVFFLKARKEKTIDSISKEVKVLLEKQNREIYRNIGYEWYTSNQIFWLQLHKLQKRVDKEKQEGVNFRSEDSDEGSYESEDEDSEAVNRPRNEKKASNGN